MAKVYAPPEGFDPPGFDEFIVDGRYNREKDDALHDAYIERMVLHARSHNSGDLVGEIVRFQIADGHAQYMVWSHKPLALIHLPIHDAWSIPDAHARGLRLTDIRERVEGDRRLREFSSRKREGSAQ